MLIQHPTQTRDRIQIEVPLRWVPRLETAYLDDLLASSSPHGRMAAYKGAWGSFCSAFGMNNVPPVNLRRGGCKP
jgi:hypothetical protein